MTTRTRTHNLTLVGIVVAVAFAIAIIAIVLSPDPRPTSPVVSASPSVASISEGGGIVLPLVQLEGEWYYQKDETEFKAVVAGKDIKIYWTIEGTTTGLYWHGTFETAESPTVTLQSQKIENSDEIVLSQSKTKDFRITQDSTIIFDFSAMGFTTKIELRR